VNHRLKKWGAPLLSFAIGQPAVQLVNLVTGFFLLRWMSVENYAQFGVAFAFQSTVGMLADLGFSSSILALAGERARNPEVVGRYIRSARHFRCWLAVGVGCVFALAFPLIIREQQWSVFTKGAILASILVAVAAQSWTIYQAPLLAHREISAVYRPQIFGGALRLGLSGLLHVLHGLSGVAASWIGTLALGISSWWTRRLGRPLICEPEKSDPQVNREMLRYLAPLIPGVIFTAFQSQISVAIITVFGSTQNIAEVAALARLGQLFGILAAFNGIIIGPYVATMKKQQFRSRYFMILGIAAFIAVLVSVLAFLFPSPLLWILGPLYQNLGAEVGWVVLTACIGYVGGVMWTMHAARKWIFWWSTMFYILLVISAQVSGALFLDLGSTRGVILLGVFSAGAGVLVHMATCCWGFWIDRQDHR
jgi:O-antigen/teichoic acid export membrane protein